MKQKITFKAKDEDGWAIQPKPMPASQFIPEWWRSIPLHEPRPNESNGNKIIVENGVSNAGAKQCMPMLDALLTGYIVTLWADVQIRQINGNPIITWRIKSTDVFQEHGLTAKMVEPPTGYSNNVFKYISTWIPITPKGYSVLITAPFGYRNTPFQAIPAVIDSDKSTLEIVPPMWVKKDFEGIVEKGTPMFQITPFKRTEWEGNYDYYPNGEYAKVHDKNFGSTIINHYKKFVWSKKSYK
jgi:hypothetical protein